MSGTGLTEREVALIRDVLGRAPAVARAMFYGSRAKGTQRPNSDIDLAVYGITSSLAVATLADDLDQLSLPYRFDVTAYDAIDYEPLREHIDRVGVEFYTRQQRLRAAPD